MGTLVSALAAVLTSLLQWWLGRPSEVARVSSGTTTLPATDEATLARRAKAFGLSVVIVALASCGQTEVVLSTLYPIEDFPGGWPRLAQGEARVILPDGTIGTVKDVGGWALVHPADLKGLMRDAKRPPP